MPRLWMHVYSRIPAGSDHGFFRGDMRSLLLLSRRFHAREAQVTQNREFNLVCPVAAVDKQKITLAHGGGGRMMQRLLDEVILRELKSDFLAERHDSAVAPMPAAARLAFTTEGYVVRPLFFPRGDIGTLAVNGTLNDLAMVGARPILLSVSFIQEEGLPTPTPEIP